VYDGHGGSRASRFASENLHKNLRDKFPKGNVELPKYSSIIYVLTMLQILSNWEGA
jgi:serine/threonine protein phosphatase PrpC